MSTLDDLEARLKSFIEERLVKFIPSGKPEDQISQKLASALYSQKIIQEDKSELAPNVYVIVANSSNLSRWRQKAGFLDELADNLETSGLEAGFEFLSKPILSISSDSSMPDSEVQVYASFSLGDMTETRGIQMNTENKKLKLERPINSFLILHGSEIISIDQSVINIGRRLDNHIVIDDPRISRNHAQIREINGNFVVFDLNSTGGTYVNGDRINQSILYPGDVISLAGVTLIFGQDILQSQQTEGPTHRNSSNSSNHAKDVLPMEDKPTV